VLSAANVIVMICLGLILTLQVQYLLFFLEHSLSTFPIQAGQVYAKRLEAADRAKLEAEIKDTGKKDQ
jgi:hypothetical protein